MAGPTEKTFWIETLGCPKNSVDSDKLVGTLVADGLVAADDPSDADVVVVNTCAFIEAAREESIETVLSLSELRRPGARLVVTGCMAERYGDELAAALPEADAIAGFGVPVTLRAGRPSLDVAKLDLLNLPRPASAAPWAYVKVAEGCDRTCGFCAIPQFRGRQRSRSVESILAEVESLAAQEIVLVAQDLASYGRDVGQAGAIVDLVTRVTTLVPRVRLLYL
jgi:ribosomal protein S12 methylthiotransferase